MIDVDTTVTEDFKPKIRILLDIETVQDNKFDLDVVMAEIRKKLSKRLGVRTDSP